MSEYQRFSIGEIVKPLFSDEVEYFVITDVEDFTREVDDLPVVDISYELMQIYPVLKGTAIEIVEQDAIKSVAKDNMKEYRMIMDFVKKERGRRGWFNEPEFISVLKKRKNPNYDKTIGYVDMMQRHDDFVEYHKLKTVDDCLDAFNDLKTLHKLFGDEAYIQLQDVVLKRLKEIA